VGVGGGARSTIKAKAARRDVLAFSGFDRHRNMIECFFTG
jgi:hypothetical protein